MVKKYIILDTNIIYNDFFFSDKEIRIISRLVTSLDIRLCLPMVIFNETINKYRNQLSMEINKLSTTVSNLQKKLNILTNYDNIDIEQNVKSYEIFLQKMFKKTNRILNYPIVSHEELVEKAILRKKPFKENGSGYRDALIWKNIIDILKTGDQVFFVTKNKKDFFDNTSLHSDLLAELSQNNILPSDFSIYEDVKSLFDDKIKPQLQIIDTIRESFLQNTLDGVDTDELFEELNKNISSLSIGDMLPDSYDKGSYHIKYHTLSIGDVDDVWLLDDSDCYINYYYNSVVDVEYYVDKNELYLKDKYEYEVEDADWNESVALVSISLDLKIAASLIYDIEKKEQIQFEYELN